MKYIVLVLVAVLAPATSAAQDSASATGARIPLAAVDSNAVNGGFEVHRIGGEKCTLRRGGRA